MKLPIPRNFATQQHPDGVTFIHARPTVLKLLDEGKKFAYIEQIFYLCHIVLNNTISIAELRLKSIHE